MILNCHQGFIFYTITKKKWPTLICDQRCCVCGFWNLVFCEMFLCFDPGGHHTMFCSVVAVNCKEIERNAFTPSRWENNRRNKIQPRDERLLSVKIWLTTNIWFQHFKGLLFIYLAPYVYQRAVWFSVSFPDLWPLNRRTWNFYIYNSLIESPYKIII